MGGLRSALEELNEDDVAVLSDEMLEEELEELERASRILEVQRACRVAEVERRRLHRRHGDVSVTAWLARRLGVPSTVAARQVRFARSLPHMPETRAALNEGCVSLASAELLMLARAADDRAFEPAESTLVELARRLSARDLRRVLEHWRAVADAAADDAAAARRFERRGLFVSPTLDGMVRIDGTLDSETGETVVTAIRSIVDVWSREDRNDLRSPAQRRADALGELSRRYLDRRDRPFVGGERPHLTVTADLDALEHRAGRRCELDDAGRVTSEALRRLACDASVSRVIVGPDSEPLDVGRRTPVVPAGIRRALVVRDGGCRFPGCDRPSAWCDAHHVVHWADGGPTGLANLVLLCRRHHRAVHEGRAPPRTVSSGPARRGSCAIAVA